MEAQNLTRQSRRSRHDKCQLTLGAARDKLQALATLFEHLDNSPCGADALKGTSATLRRISKDLGKAAKLLDDAY